MEAAAGVAGAGGGMEKVVLKGPRACSTCARAKSRCIAGPARQEKCERCYRLRKPCSSQTPAPPRKRKEPKPTRVSEIERRLEDLTARIESVHRLGPAAPSPPDSDHYPPAAPLPQAASHAPTYPITIAPDDGLPPQNRNKTRVPLPTFGQDAWESPFGHLFPERSIFEGPTEHHHAPASSATRPAGEDSSPSLLPLPGSRAASQTMATAGSAAASPAYQFPSFQDPPQQQQQPQAGGSVPWPHGDEADTLLDVYRKHLGHLFPFTVVPPHLSAAQLQAQRPLLWKAVMMEACLFDGPRQVALGTELLREISEAAFMKPQKNLDLLQGLQMLIAWYHYNLNNFQMVNLLFLARSITTSLGSAESRGSPDEVGYDSESLEQMRAFAGTYYLVTITFTTNKRPDALMNTSYLTTCCRALHGQMEYPTDELVVHLVRAQQLSQSISQGFARRKAIPNENQIPQGNFIQGLRERIRTFAAALPSHIRANPSLAGHLQVAEILVYENSMDDFFNSSFTSGKDGSVAGIATPPIGEDHAACVEMLCEGARVVHAFMTSRFAHDIGEYPRFIRLASFDLTYVFLTMLKLVTLQAPGWDLARVRQELRFDEFMSQLIEHMQNTAQRRKKKSNTTNTGGASSTHESIGQKDEAEDPYTKLARKARIVKDRLLLSPVDSAYATHQVARVCDPAPMTLHDATQDLMQDLGMSGGGSLWPDRPAGAGADAAGGAGSEWDLFFVGEAVDWAAVFSSYDMGEPGWGL
ncbi:protein priB [Staphylotrichum tortipilum]|uniref:Protein priB n=1 Tax=Staphylotrichum tortipilum TaxID=2831512 RepID=A0AAN6MSN8_9PEZI|nr:protein priB [Staphylotrichum longicolle]